MEDMSQAVGGTELANEATETVEVNGIEGNVTEVNKVCLQCGDCGIERSLEVGNCYVCGLKNEIKELRALLEQVLKN